MTPEQISVLAQKMVERFPVLDLRSAYTGVASVDLAQLEELHRGVVIRTRQVIIDELNGFSAQQPVKLREVVRTHVCTVLERHGWNRTAAAQVLGVSTKTVLNMVARWRKAGCVIPPWNGTYRG